MLKSSLKSWARFISDKLDLKSAVKISMAATLSLFLGLVFNKIFKRPDTLISGLWCVLAAIVVLQQQVGGTYKAAWVRFSGVAIGSVIGSLFLIHLGADYPISLGGAIFLTIITCSLLNLNESVRIASLSTAIIIIFGGLNPSLNPWVFSFFRFIDSCIGIIIAVFIAHTLWPEKASENLRLNIIKIISLLSKQYRMVIDLRLERNIDLQTIDDTFSEIQELFYQNLAYLEESKLELPNSRGSEECAYMISQLEIINDSTAALRNVNLEILTKIFDDSLSNQIINVITKTDAGMNSLIKILEREGSSFNFNDLSIALKDLNEDLLRFRATRTIRKFNLEDVESFYVFFYRLRTIGEAVIKIGENIQKSDF